MSLAPVHNHSVPAPLTQQPHAFMASGKTKYPYVKLCYADRSQLGQEIILYIRTAMEVNAWAKCYLQNVSSKTIYKHYCDWVKAKKEQGALLGGPAGQRRLISVLHRLLPGVRPIKPANQRFPSQEVIKMQWAAAQKAIADQKLLEGSARGVKRKSPPLQGASPPKRIQRPHIALTKQGSWIAKFIKYCTEEDQWPASFYAKTITSTDLYTHYSEVTQWLKEQGYEVDGPSEKVFFMKVLHMLIPQVSTISRHEQTEYFPSKEIIQAQWEKMEAAIAQLGDARVDTVNGFLSDPSNRDLLSGNISVDDLFASYIDWCRMQGHARYKSKLGFEAALSGYPFCIVSDGSVTFTETQYSPPESPVRGIKSQSSLLYSSLSAQTSIDIQQPNVALSQEGRWVARFVEHCTENDQWPVNFYSSIVTSTALYIHYCQFTEWMKRQDPAFDGPAHKIFFMRTLHKLIPDIRTKNKNKKTEYFPSKEMIQAQWERTKACIIEYRSDIRFHPLFEEGSADKTEGHPQK